MPQRRAKPVLFALAVLALAALALALVRQDGGGADGGPARDAALARVRAFDAARLRTPAEIARLEEACRAFIGAYGDDLEAPQVRRSLALILARRGDDREAERELERALPGTPTGSAFRLTTLYILGEVRIRLGSPEAVSALATIVAEAPASEAGKMARQDLADLARIGKPAAGLLFEAGDPLVASATARALPFALAFVKATEPRLADLPPEAVVVAAPDPAWQDPRVKRAAPPALPRVYVVDGRGVVRAAGVRKEGLQEALRKAQEP